VFVVDCNEDDGERWWWRTGRKTSGGENEQYAIYVEAMGSSPNILLTNIFNLFCDISRLTRRQYGRENYVKDEGKQKMTMTMTMAGIHNRKIYGNQQKGE
jgi:hypothetical protein